MMAHLCDQCGAVLPKDKYFQVIAFESEFGCGKGVGTMVTRIGGRHLCRSCMMGFVEIGNGDTEIRNVRKHETNIDREKICRLYYSEGMKIMDIVKETGYSRTSVTRAISEKKKAASGNEGK